MKTLICEVGRRKDAGRFMVFALLVVLLMSVMAPMMNYEVYGATDSDITIRYLDIDGKVLKEGVVSSGAILDPPSNPVKSGMKFLGWDKYLGGHTVDTDINAVYELNMSTDKEQSGKLAEPDSAEPPKEPAEIVIASSTEGSVTVDTSEEAITTPEIIKTPPVPEAASEDAGISTSTIILSILAGIVALVLVGYIFLVVRKRRKQNNIV